MSYSRDTRRLALSRNCINLMGFLLNEPCYILVLKNGAKQALQSIGSYTSKMMISHGALTHCPALVVTLRTVSHKLYFARAGAVMLLTCKHFAFMRCFSINKLLLLPVTVSCSFAILFPCLTSRIGQRGWLRGRRISEDVMALHLPITEVECRV